MSKLPYNNVPYNDIVYQYLMLSLIDIFKYITTYKTDICIEIKFNINVEGVAFPHQQENSPVIILQNKYKNLSYDQYGFTVDLEINGEMQNIYIPFRAIELIRDTKAGFAITFTDFHDDENKSINNIVIIDLQKDDDDEDDDEDEE